MIHGLRLSFHTEPTLSLEPDPSILTGFSQSQKILPFIPDWIRNGYVREILSPTPLFFSRMFTVPKKNGRLRPVIDLSVLNKLLIVPKFRMESVARITKAITSPKWGTTTDLEDAYFKVPVEEESQIYLAFTLFDQSLGFYRIFVFQVMPFGLSSAPWTFTRVLKPIKIHLHLRGMTVFSYLDDFLNLADTPLQVKSQTNFLVSLLNSLGFAVNLRKSSHVPSQSLEYLGVTWNLQDLSLALPEAKVQKVLNLHRSTLNTPVLSRRDLERIVGYLNFTAPFRPLGRLYLLPIIQWMNSHSTVHNRDSPLPLDSSLRRILDPWSNQKALSSPVPMHIPNPSEELMTDASLFGWSGVLLPHRVEGGWHRSLWFHSMNWKELQAILLTVIHFLPRLKGKAVKVWSDNMTALACIRRQGSAHSPALLELASSLLILCHRHNITLIPSHIQGVLNVLADAGSRRGPIATEWSLDPHSFKEICHLWGRPQLDLFATRYNTQLWTFVSPCPDPAALCMDAMAWDWNVWQSVYLFPPLRMLPQVASKLEDFWGTGFVIAPFWPSQDWFVMLARRARYSIPLHPQHYLFQYTTQGLEFYPNISILNLHAWRL